MVGLLPAVFWSLTWNDYDALCYQYVRQQQQALAGHRAVATQLYNALGSFSKDFTPVREAEYWALPLLDPAPAPVNKADDAAWWAHMRQLAAASGKTFTPVPTD